MRNMISYDEALERIDATVTPLAPQTLALAQLAGTGAAGALHSRIDVPTFANAAMDGFALRAADTCAASPATAVTLAVAGRVAAGEAPPPAPPPGAVIEIMTGAPLPDGCDTVVPIERVEVLTDGPQARSIRLAGPVDAGRNVRLAGEDYHAGDLVVTTGRHIEAHTIMALAATGADALSARTAPRCSVLTTGSELGGSGIPAGPGQIRDANGPYIEAFLGEAGARFCERRHADDTPDALIAALHELRPGCDVILTTGGVSAGRFDLVPDAVARAGGRIIFHKVAIRPGKPLLFAQFDDGTLFFGLPGNPIAAAVCLRFFVVPALRRLQGLAAERWHAAISDSDIRKREELAFFGKARAGVDASGRLRVTLLPGQESFRIAPFAASNCWAIVPPGRARVAAGDTIELAPLSPTEFLQEPG